MPDIHLCSFASPDLKRSAERFEKQASEFNIYKKIKIYGYNDLSDEIKIRIKNFDYPIKKMRLFGYACWKPYIVNEFLKLIPDDDILQYTDIGCHINKNGMQRMREYIRICDKNGALVFQYRKPEWYKKYNNFKFQEYFEYEYTKSDAWKSMQISDDSPLLKSEQIWSGFFFIKKNDIGKKIVFDWKLFSEKDNLINDNIAFNPNHYNFKEHRHDQSLFSLICKKENIFSLSVSECEWAEVNNKKIWIHLANNPILAKRDKKFNFIKRFYMRQIKNIKRIKRKFF